MMCPCLKKNQEKYQHGKHEDRRNHILDAAFAVFIEHGIANTKMEDIARAAGYGKSTLYEYFDSKDEIFSELLRVKLTRRYRVIADAAGKESSPAEKLKAFIVGEMDMMREYGGKERLEGLLMGNPEAFAPEFFKAIHEAVLFKFERISGYIIEGVRSGSFTETDPYLAASLVIGSSMSYLGVVTSPEYKAATAGSGVTDDERLQIYFALIFRALGAEMCQGDV
jgi:TetR/AcrR family fatty acid metabolism transcriptional regulator